MNQQKCKAILLPTDKASTIGLNTESKVLYYFLKIEDANIPSGEYENQHLYILSSTAEIKEGDWVIYDNSVIQIGNGLIGHKSQYRKIIATTNPLLTADHIAHINQSDIEWMIAEYNMGKMDEVMVEYEEKSCYVMSHINSFVVNKEVNNRSTIKPKLIPTGVGTDGSICLVREQKINYPRLSSNEINHIGKGGTLQLQDPYSPTAKWINPEDYLSKKKEVFTFNGERVFTREDMEKAFNSGQLNIIGGTGQGTIDEQDFDEWFNKNF